MVKSIINVAGQKSCPDVGRNRLEVKSYTDQTAYKKAITQAAAYGKQLELKKISLVFFIEEIDDTNRQKYEITTVDKETGVTVEVIFVTTSGEA